MSKRTRVQRKEYLNKENNHHLIQRVERNSFNVDIPENVTKMKEYKHNALHDLFQNLTHPKLQFQYLGNLCEPVMSGTAKSLVNTLTSLSDHDFYIPWLKRWKKEKQ